MDNRTSTINSLATELGISATAVSLALRGKPGVSEALRTRVLEAAKTQGYVPNSVASELMAMVRARKRNSNPGDLVAYVNALPSAKEFNDIPTFRNFFDGAAERGLSYGYRLERFDAHSPGMTGARLTQILKARGVRGVLIGGRWYNDKELNIDWSAFSVVLVGETEYKTNICRVSNHHTHTTANCIKKLAELGYRRIGVALRKKYEETRSFEWSLGVEQFRRSNQTDAQAEEWLYGEWDELAFLTWVDQCKLDAVVSLAPEAAHVLERLRAERGRAPAYAALDVRPGTNWSGINQDSRQIGAVAMDLLRSLLLSGERGVVFQPRTVLMEGTWIDGQTAPPVNPPQNTH